MTTRTASSIGRLPLLRSLRARWRVAVFLCHPLELLAGVIALGLRFLGPQAYHAALAAAAAGAAGALLRHAWVGACIWAGLLAWLISDGPMLPMIPSLLPLPIW